MRLQQLGRKYQIERVRRQQDVTGYHYWLIVDYPGGTGEGDSWEEGWFDYFWQPEGHHAARGPGDQRRRAAADRRGRRRSQLVERRSAEPRSIVIISNYGQSDLRDAPLSWKLLDRRADDRFR